MISTTLVTYNRLEYTKKCVDSLMESCDELIIIDNNSTDGTKEYLTTLPVRVVMLEKNYYPGFAANYWLVNG